MVTIKQGDENGRGAVWCDPCIEPIVRALNDAGIPTIASCCGHERRPGRISLTDGRDLFIMPDFESGQALSASIPGDINS